MSRAVGPFRGVYGVDQVRGFWVVPVTLHMRGRDGIEVSARVTQVWTVRGGTLVRMCMYQERQEALEAVGLSE
jgi:hypothetical protein